MAFNGLSIWVTATSLDLPDKYEIRRACFPPWVEGGKSRRNYLMCMGSLGNRSSSQTGNTAHRNVSQHKDPAPRRANNPDVGSNMAVPIRGLWARSWAIDGWPPIGPLYSSHIRKKKKKVHLFQRLWHARPWAVNRADLQYQTQPVDMSSAVLEKK